jgi:hypothetical protein
MSINNLTLIELHLSVASSVRGAAQLSIRKSVNARG